MGGTMFKRIWRWGLPLLIATGIAACDQAGSQIPPTAAVALVGGGEFNPLPGLITWSRDPNFVLFRAEIAGSEDPFLGRNIVPECTIYGDNRVVWLTEGGDGDALEDRLSDGAISAFIQYLAVNERIYTFTEKLPELAAQYETVPMVERVTIAVNDITHRADGLGGWDSAWFDRVLTACESLSTTPVLIAPQGGWLTTQEVPYAMEPPLVVWDSASTGISLGSYTSDTPGWVTGVGVAELWGRLHALPFTSIYQDGDQFFHVALQVPGVTLASPPAPPSS